MRNSSLSLLFWILLFFARINLISATTSILKSRSRKHRAIFVFGDSLYDPGNNNFLKDARIYLKANYPPYGETFFKNPTGRFSDGRVICDFIALHANLTLWKPYLDPGNHNFIHGANFASGSACVTSDCNTETINLEQQLSFFKKVASLLRQQLGDAEAKKVLRNAVYLSSLGGVDYNYFKSVYPNATESAMQEFVKLVIEDITGVAKEIYKMGGRRFAFQNVGPLGCLPADRWLYNLTDHECEEETLALARLHNNALSNVCRELESQLSGFRYSIFDYYTSLLDRIKDSSKYGFKTGYTACCGSGLYNGGACGIGEYELCDDPNEYLFFDHYHPTEHAYSQLTELFWEGDPNVTWPINIKQLFEIEPDIDSFLIDDDVGDAFIDE